MIELQELNESRLEWLALKMGVLAAAVETVTSPMSDAKHLTKCMEDLATHGEYLGHVNEWIPVAEDYVQQAKAIATESYMKSDDSISPSVLKTLADGKIHDFTRMSRQFDRLSATLTHRMDALRTLISAGKELAYQDQHMPKQS